MYVQLILNVLIGFVSVRLLLNALGQSDYGVYDLIAGVVGLLSFISNSLSQSSMRFISVSLGKEVQEETNKVVSSCRWLHLAIAIGLVLVLEFVGLFLFKGFLNIPENRVSVAKVIYQCMILSLFIKINSSPLSALICSYEDFWYKAIVSITESLLKLVIALVVISTSVDKLLLYGILMVGVSIINYCMYYVYSHLKFDSVVRLRKPEIDGIKDVTGFAGWTLLDTLGSVVNRQGYSVLLNKFFGPIMNSAFAVSRQLEGHIFTISSSVVNSMKPQIMKSHGNGDDDRMFRLSMTAGKFGYSMMALVAIPLIVTMPEVLHIWLNTVPEHTALFSRLLIIACMIEQLTRGLVHANQALGNIKWFSISISFVRIMALPISTIVLLKGAPAFMAIIVFVICESIGSFSRVFILARISSFRPSLFFKRVLIPVLAPTFLASIMCVVVNNQLKGLFGLFLSFLIAVVCYSIVLFLFGLSKNEKNSILVLLNTQKKEISNE